MDNDKRLSNLISREWGNLEADLAAIVDFQHDNQLSPEWTEQVSLALRTASTDGLSSSEAVASIAFVSSEMFSGRDIDVRRADFVANLDDQFRDGLTSLLARMDDNRVLRNQELPHDQFDPFSFSGPLPMDRVLNAIKPW